MEIIYHCRNMPRPARTPKLLPNVRFGYDSVLQVKYLELRAYATPAEAMLNSLRDYVLNATGLESFVVTDDSVTITRKSDRATVKVIDTVLNTTAYVLYSLDSSAGSGWCYSPMTKLYVRRSGVTPISSVSVTLAEILNGRKLIVK